MNLHLNRWPLVFGASLLLAAAVAACSGGSGGSSSVPSGSSGSSGSSTPAPTAAPTSSSSGSSGSSTPTPTASATAPPTWTFSGAQGTMTATQGQTASVSLGAYQNISVTSVQFSTDTSGSGTLSVSDALNNGDVSPNTLPADNVNAYTTVLYISFVNASATTITFGTTTPTVTISDSAGFGGATTCELDVYQNSGSGNSWSWATTGATGTISGNNVTLNPVTLSGGNSIDFKQGQQIAAIGCK